MMPKRTSSQKHNLMETKIPKISFIPHSTNLRLLHLLAVAFLSAHLGLFVNAESKELFDDANRPQRPSDNDNDKFLNDADASEIMDKLKRSWKSLQGSWGKRSNDPTTSIDDYENEPEWTLIKANENSRESESEPDAEPEAMKYFVLYASNPNTLAESIGATSTNNLREMGDNMEEGPSASNYEKKSWKNMNVAWGKRRSAVWNKFRGAWGKREPAWNNLKGMWGKRSTKDWKKLQSAWGKRSQQQKSI